jgi:hypothetical protein
VPRQGGQKEKGKVKDRPGVFRAPRKAWERANDGLRLE